jgi:hypothetical protein
MADKTTILSLLTGLGLGAAAVFGLAGAQRAPAADASPIRPVLVELFTSQGCSSCPPADAFAEVLARDPQVVMITRPVTYWDRLGWKDTLGREENSELQRRYAGHGKAGAGVYTPQMVVNGGDAAVGSDRKEVLRQVRDAYSASAPAIAVRPGVIAVSGASGDAADVTIVALKSAATVRIGRGENGGRTIRYSNVFLGETRLGSWAGGTRTYAIPAAATRVAGADRFAVVIQQPKTGRVLSARYL